MEVAGLPNSGGALEKLPLRDKWLEGIVLRLHTSSTIAEAGGLFALVDLSFQRMLSRLKLADEKPALIRAEGFQASVFDFS